MEGRVLESRGAKCPFPTRSPVGVGEGNVPSPTPGSSIQGNAASSGLFGLAATQPLPASDQPSGREEGRILREGRPGVPRHRPRVHYVPGTLLVNCESSLGPGLAHVGLFHTLLWVTDCQLPDFKLLENYEADPSASFQLGRLSLQGQETAGWAVLSL